MRSLSLSLTKIVFNDLIFRVENYYSKIVFFISVYLIGPTVISTLSRRDLKPRLERDAVAVYVEPGACQKG